jgi:hypothetical protein
MRNELMNIEEKVKEMIGRAAGLPAEKIAADIKLADLDMESLE